MTSSIPAVITTAPNALAIALADRQQAITKLEELDKLYEEWSAKYQDADKRIAAEQAANLAQQQAQQLAQQRAVYPTNKFGEHNAILSILLQDPGTIRDYREWANEVQARGMVLMSDTDDPRERTHVAKAVDDVLNELKDMYPGCVIARTRKGSFQLFAVPPGIADTIATLAPPVGVFPALPPIIPPEKKPRAKKDKVLAATSAVASSPRVAEPNIELPDYSDGTVQQPPSAVAKAHKANCVIAHDLDIIKYGSEWFVTVPDRLKAHRATGNTDWLTAKILANLIRTWMPYGTGTWVPDWPTNDALERWISDKIAEGLFEKQVVNGVTEFRLA